MATKRRKRRSRKPVRTKKGGKRRYKISCKKSKKKIKKKSFRMRNVQLKSKTKSKGTKFGGGGGGGTPCRPCFDNLQYFKVKQSTPSSIAGRMKYSRIKKVEKDCIDCMNFAKRYKNRLKPGMYEKLLRDLIPQAEKLRDAKKIQLNPNALENDIMFEDMMEYKLKQLKKR